MARVNGVEEKLHLTLYDALEVPQGDTVATVMQRLGDEGGLHFFTNLANKTKLETNLQQAGRLPSQNSYEVYALRIVTSRAPEWAGVPAIGGAPAIAAAPFLVATENFASALIYSSVTSVVVGEKVMQEAVTYLFPSGAGLALGVGAGAHTSNGLPDPMATFRFSAPVKIEPHQSFRVDMLFPRGVPTHVAQAGTPGLNGRSRGDMATLHVWCVLDGFMTRDVQ